MEYLFEGVARIFPVGAGNLSGNCSRLFAFCPDWRTFTGLWNKTGIDRPGWERTPGRLRRVPRLALPGLRMACAGLWARQARCRERDAEAGKRQRQVLRASCVSIAGNAVLSVAKIVVGFISGSFAVVSDGIDSASDVAISIVMIVTAKIMGRKPNKKYVYGYAKAESIATKLLSMLIFFAGAEMLISAVQHLFSKDPRVMPQAIAIYVTVFSIVCKLLLARYQTVVGKRAGSSMLVANGVNMRNDVLISLSVLAGLFFSIGLDLPVLDSVTALIVSCFIIRSAIKIFMDSNVELMDGVKDESVYQKIFDAINGVEGVGNPHRVRSRSIGGKYMITLDVEADGKLTLNQAHALASQVEQSIRETIPEVYDIVVHVEPFGTHPEEVFGINKKAK